MSSRYFLDWHYTTRSKRTIPLELELSLTRSGSWILERVRILQANQDGLPVREYAPVSSAARKALLCRDGEFAAIETSADINAVRG